jgi:hypothetical protein
VSAVTAPSLTALYAAGLAVASFAAVTSGKARPAGVVIVTLLVIAASMAGVGSWVGHRRPGLAALFMRAWTVLVTTLAASVGAAVFAATLSLAVDDRTGREQVLAGGVLAVVVLLGEQLTGWLESVRAPWFSKSRVCRKYLRLFQSVPGQSGPGWVAANRLRPGCSNYEPNEWDIRGTRAMLETIQQAITADEYEGGANWVPAPPPPGPQERPPL